MQKSLAFKVAALVAGAYSLAISACGAQGETAGGGGRYNGSGGTPSGSGGTPAATGGTPGGAGVVGSTGGTPVGAGGTPVGSAGSFGVGGSVGSAGSFGVGGSVGTGGAPPANCTSTGTVTSMAGGFMTSGTFSGYVYLFSGGAGTTISPANFMSLAANAAPCICGSVAATADYSGIAAVGFNLSQMMGGTEMAIAPPMTGIAYTITSVPSGARLQIVGADSATNPMHQWCAPITAATGQVPWASFQYQCWEGGMQTPFDPATNTITAVQVIVPGTNAAAVPYDFCLTSVTAY